MHPHRPVTTLTKNPELAVPVFSRQRILAHADALALHRKLAVVACLLVVAHCLAMVSRFYFERDIVFGLVPLFDFYEERNIPTYFSSFNLLLTAGILFTMARLDKLNGKHMTPAWRVLGWGFLFMSLDEFADMRMILSRIADGAAGAPLLEMVPFLSVAWTVPVVLILLGLTAYFVPFLLHLDKRYALHFCLAGAGFVLASVGLETTEGNHINLVNAGRDIPFTIMVTVEETIEIFSILYFQYFLIRYASQYHPDTRIQLSR